MSELFGNPEQVSELSGNPEQLPYTPTTEEVRAAYESTWLSDTMTGRDVEFDRWLAEVKAEAWQEGFDRGVLFFNSGDERNPYKQKEEQ